MLKYLTHKLRTQSINENHQPLDNEDGQQPPIEKVEGHDSGTESDGEELDRQRSILRRFDRFLDDNDYDIEIDGSMMMSADHETTTSPSSDTMCSIESPHMFPDGHPPANHNFNALYDPNNSSEEELEVINGPTLRRSSGTNSEEEEVEQLEERDLHSPVSDDHRPIGNEETTDKLTERENGEKTSTICGEPGEGGKNSSLLPSMTTETRKRSLANIVDEEVRCILDILPGPPLNFRTSPPLEALKPHRQSHSFVHHAKGPLILVANHRGDPSAADQHDKTQPEHNNNIHNNNNNHSTNRNMEPLSTKLHRCRYIEPPVDFIAIHDCANYSNRTNAINDSFTRPSSCNRRGNQIVGRGNKELCDTSEEDDEEERGYELDIEEAVVELNTCGDMEQELENFNLDSIRISYESPADFRIGRSPINASTHLDDLRSVSPPAKLFHCAVSPKRRPLKHPQRPQRQHRPCLDFDKMQQLKTRSVSTWRHNNEHTGGELSVFCW